MSVDIALSVWVTGVRGSRYGYSREWVDNLHAGIARNLPYAVEHRCLTDQPEAFKGSQVTPIDIGPWWRGTGLTSGWWAKVALHHFELFETGQRLLYSDIDNMITGDLSPLVEDAEGHPFAACPMTSQNFRATDPHMERRISSAFMIWSHGATSHAFSLWRPQETNTYYGDQDYLGSEIEDPHVLPREHFVRGTRLVRRGFQALKPNIRVVFCTKAKCDKMVEIIPETKRFWHNATK